MSTAILTIDDIASANTPAIVDYLCEKRICAILFAVGQNVERYYEEAVYALKKGMIVGNHSYTHPHFSELSLKQCIEEIERNEEVLNRLYRDAGVERRYRPLRFPYGDKGRDGEGGAVRYEALQTYLRENHFTKVKDEQIDYPWYHENHLDRDIDTFWTFDFGEYQIWTDGFERDFVYDRIHNAHPESGDVLLREGNQHIILMHAHDETEALWPAYYREFLDYVMARGVDFVPPVFC